jgi:hypothetical protein
MLACVVIISAENFSLPKITFQKAYELLMEHTKSDADAVPTPTAPPLKKTRKTKSSQQRRPSSASDPNDPHTFDL